MEKLPSKFYCLATDRDLGRHNFRNDEIAVMLTNSEPQRTWETPADVPEIPAVNGYVAGGFALTKKQFRSVRGVNNLLVSPLVITASGGEIGPFRWLVIYNKTAGRLMSFVDYGGEDEIAPGQALTIDFGLNGVHSSM